jgi:hypothetical protein
VVFRCDEVSLTVDFIMGTKTHYLTVFLGGLDPFGTDSFTAKLLGGAPVSSFLLQHRISPNGSAVFGTTGYGAAYRFRLSRNMALGATVTIPGGGTDTGLFADARFAGTFARTTVELAGGMAGAAGYYGAGSFLWGSKYRNSFLFQGGLLVSQPSDLLSKLFLILEPRFIMGPAKLNLTLFALPWSGTNLRNLLFVPFANTEAPATEDLDLELGTAGVGITFYSDTIPVGIFQGTLGLIVAAGLDQNLLTSIGAVLAGNTARHLHAQISPFFDLGMQNGVFRLRLGIDPLGQTTTGDSNLLNTIQFHIGYLTRF